MNLVKRSLGLFLIATALATQLETSGVVAYSNTPTSIIATSEQGSASISATWTTASGASKYQVQLRIGSTTGLIIRTSEVPGTNSRTMSFLGVEYNLDYYVGVRAGDSGGWGAYVFASAIKPVAASPSPPSKPEVSSPSDGQLDISWSPPANNGGAKITNYIVQLFVGAEIDRAPVTTSNLVHTFKGLSTKSKYSVNVKAVNEESKTSEASELSDAKAPAKDAALAVSAPVIAPAFGNTPASGGVGGNTPSSGGGSNTPASGGSSNQPATEVPAASPVAVQTPPNLVSPLPALLPYSKLVTLKSTTSKSTLSSLSKLSVPKGATTSFVIGTTSKKYCSLRGTSVYMFKAGTCAITFTVKTKAGKKTSRTVKLVVR